ncbi:unnamed protein product [Acanthosepion pharaonis]|nr:unnamed protein product [Sepia pharaonis]
MAHGGRCKKNIHSNVTLTIFYFPLHVSLFLSTKHSLFTFYLPLLLYSFSFLLRFLFQIITPPLFQTPLSVYLFTSPSFFRSFFLAPTYETSFFLSLSFTRIIFPFFVLYFSSSPFSIFLFPFFFYRLRIFLLSRSLAFSLFVILSPSFSRSFQR